tara:strand:- start:2299 stop:2799 length:501 start_codon:yes stop_codon:yes gene_type:complete
VVKIIDNFIDKDLYLQVKNTLFSDSLPWFSKKGTVNGKENDLNWFSHSIYNDFKPNSNIFSFMPEFIEKLKISSIIEIRTNLSFKTNKDFKTLWHTDYGYKNHKTAIFYFNTDTTGTVFKIKNKEKLIKSKENRIVIFDGSIKHCAYLNNKSEKRVVINFNYYEKN